MRKLPITVLMIGLLAVVGVWLWPSAAPHNSTVVADEDSNSSRLSGRLPSPQVSSQTQTDQWLNSDLIERPRLSEEQTVGLQQSFAQANQQLSQGDLQAAASAYSDLITKHPNFVEPYVNLASIQAELGQLEQARQTLLKGAEANQSTKVLFDSINKLHGALAAQAYRSALESEVSDVVRPSLPKARDLSTDFEQADRVFLLTKRLAQEKTKQASLTASNQELIDVRKQLIQASDQMSTISSGHNEALKSLRIELDLEKERVKLVENKLTLLESQSSSVESDLVAKLRIELSDVEASLRQSKVKFDDLLAVNEDLNRELITVKAGPAVIAATTASPTPIEVEKVEQNVDTAVDSAPETITDARRAVAANLVKEWAAAWSSQDVNSYLDFYRDDYTSSSNLSHQQWVAQRRVRLTNKSFIDVGVSDFLVATTDSGFSVTFTQHYRSNTLDDTIKKRMSFTLSSGQSWRDAKIHGEKIVGR